MACVKDQNGNHVIQVHVADQPTPVCSFRSRCLHSPVLSSGCVILQKCIEKVPAVLIQFIVEAFMHHVSIHTRFRPFALLAFHPFTRSRPCSCLRSFASAASLHVHCFGRTADSEPVHAPLRLPRHSAPARTLQRDSEGEGAARSLHSPLFTLPPRPPPCLLVSSPALFLVCCLASSPRFLPFAAAALALTGCVRRRTRSWRRFWTTRTSCARTSTETTSYRSASSLHFALDLGESVTEILPKISF